MPVPPKERQAEAIMVTARQAGIVRMVVNGSCEEDWPTVLALARRYPEVLPSFGYHPWYIKQRTPDWQEHLVQHLEQHPSAVGEIGLDRWIKDFDLADQENVFVWQLKLAAERNLAVSIHCLQAWGLLFELLRAGPRPARGFLLHSYGGPKEMVEPLARLGAYFSIPGYFALERKMRQRETFACVPRERLLIETDAPDQGLPPERIEHSLFDPHTRQPIYHPANLAAVYRFAAEVRKEPLETLATQVEENFQKLFPIIAMGAPPTEAHKS